MEGGTCRSSLRLDWLHQNFDIHSKTKNIFNMYINYVEIKRIEHYILPMYLLCKRIEYEY